MAAKPEAALSRKQFGERVRAARRKAGLTQQALADRANYSVITLSKIETGVNFPTLEVFMALAKALDTTPDQLLGWGLLNKSEANEGASPSTLDGLVSVAEGLPDEWISLLTRLAAMAATRKGSG